MGTRLIALLWVLLSGVASAAEGLPWYIGLPVAQVSLEDPDGRLPPEKDGDVDER